MAYSGEDEAPSYYDLDHYCVDLKQKLGQGMFGIVYWGVDKPRTELVAIKECPTKTPEHHTMAMTEMQALQSISHDNILALRTIIFKASALWLVTDFCDLGQLDDFFLANHPVPESTQVELMVQMHRALTYMHTRPGGKVVHRDVKPANVLLHYGSNPRPVIKIADLGLAKIAERSAGQGLAAVFQATAAKGNIAFMAPEMASGGVYDEGVDVFALGLVFLAMLQFQKERRFMMPQPDNTKNVCGGVSIGQAMAMGVSVKIAGTKFSESRGTKDVKNLIQKMTNKDTKKRIPSKDSLLAMENVFDRVKGSLAPPPPRPKPQVPKSIQVVLSEAGRSQYRNPSPPPSDSSSSEEEPEEAEKSSSEDEGLSGLAGALMMGAVMARAREEQQRREQQEAQANAVRGMLAMNAMRQMLESDSHSEPEVRFVVRASPRAPQQQVLGLGLAPPGLQMMSPAMRLQAALRGMLDSDSD